MLKLVANHTNCHDDHILSITDVCCPPTIFVYDGHDHNYKINYVLCQTNAMHTNLDDSLKASLISMSPITGLYAANLYEIFYAKLQVILLKVHNKSDNSLFKISWKYMTSIFTKESFSFLSKYDLSGIRNNMSLAILLPRWSANHV